MKFKRLDKPSILREHVGEIDHPIHGAVGISQPLNRAAIIFEFGDVYYVASLEELASELFDQIEKTHGGKP